MVLSMDRWKGKVAVVTGASAGIGALITEQLVEAGVKVAGLARRKERIEELSKRLSSREGTLFSVKCDMSNETDILNAFEWVKENLGPVSILINNAGLMEITNLIEGDTKLWKNILDVNVLGLSIATREAVKSMRKNKIDGHICHINSLAGHTIHYFPYLGMYGASKYAVTALTETLRKELNAKNSRIKITSISPGLVATEFLDGLKASHPKYNTKEFDARPSLNSEDVADAVLYALSTPPHVQVHEVTILPVGQG